MKQDNGGRGLRTAVIVCLAAIFALLAMGVTLMGSGIYRSTAADADMNDSHRTALSYVVNQIRRGDALGVSVGDFGGVRALRLTEAGADGTIYETLIYCYDGQLRELYMELGNDLSPADGMGLMDLSSLDFSVEGGLLTVSAGDSAGNLWSVALSPRSGLEEVGEL